MPEVRVTAQSLAVLQGGAPETQARVTAQALAVLQGGAPETQVRVTAQSIAVLRSVANGPVIELSTIRPRRIVTVTT